MNLDQTFSPIQEGSHLYGKHNRDNHTSETNQQTQVVSIACRYGVHIVRVCFRTVC